MDILTVGTDLFLEDPAIGKDQLFHFTRFWRHKLHILSREVYHIIRIV